MKKFKAIYLVLFSLIIFGNKAFSQVSYDVPVGSYIINMGTVPQTFNNGLKPYGLVYDLLKNNKVPVKWVISSSKVKDGVDFTHNGIQYRGGTFIIPAGFRTTAVNNKIASYGVTGVTTTSAFTVQVTHTLVTAPVWTLDQKNGDIAQDFFSLAGIPSSAYNWKDPALLGACDDIFVMPHADPTWATHGNLYNWNRNQFGAIWAGCHAVSVLENMNNGTLQTNFLATNVGAIGNALVPYGSHANATPPYTHSEPTNPASQYMGITDDAHTNGSEQVYLPKLGGGWRSTTRMIAFDPTQSNVPTLSAGPAAIIAHGRGFGLNNAGWVMYQAGHDLTKGSTTNQIAAIRAFFNFSFLASMDKVPTVSTSTLPDTVTGGTNFNMSVNASSPVGSSFTYAWTSSCGGTFSSTTSATPTFTPPIVSSETQCVITCTMTDACGRVSFASQTVVVRTPAPPVLKPIEGNATICVGSTTNLSNEFPGGTWTSSNPAVATVNSSGVVTSVSAGDAIITYTATNAYGTSSVTRTVTVGTVPQLAPISGVNFFCINTTTPLTNSTIGGTWSSNNTTIATVNGSGVVSGLKVGGVIISYAVTNSCGTTTVTKGLTVNANPVIGPIVGANTVYTNQTTTFTDSVANGTWASLNTAIATVNASGVVTGIAPGTTEISYSVSNNCGTISVTKSITVLNLAPTAKNDTVNAQYNIPVNINPLTNDLIGSYAFNPTSIEFLPGTAPSSSTVGTFVINPNGTVTFTSVSSFSGVATIGYKIFDQAGQSTTAYIVVNVSGPCSVDGDNDGVPDCLDEYPTDVHRAFNNFFPPNGFATLMYEDEWPNRADYDLNDVVVDYRANTITNGLNQVVEMKYTMVARCSGAGLHNGFAFQLDNVPSNKVSKVTGAKANGASWLSIGSNGLENGQDFANIIVYDDIYKVIPYPGSGSFVNTYMISPKTPYDTSNIVITFIDNGVAPSGGTISISNLPHAAFNPYIIIGDSGSFDQIRSKELHLPNRIPTNKMDYTWFGLKDDNSIPGQGRYYKTLNNLPWGLQISTSVPYMQEKQDISTGYLKFLEWATSNGTAQTNWYMDLSGNRDNSKIYTK